VKPTYIIAKLQVDKRQTV